MQIKSSIFFQTTPQQVFIFSIFAHSLSLHSHKKRVGGANGPRETASAPGATPTNQSITRREKQCKKKFPRCQKIRTPTDRQDGPSPILSWIRGTLWRNGILTLTDLWINFLLECVSHQSYADKQRHQTYSRSTTTLDIARVNEKNQIGLNRR